MSSEKKLKPLFWSHLQAYEACPQGFLWGYGWAHLDQGGGPGRPRPLPDPKSDSRHHAVMGLVLSKALEYLYNEELYRDPENLRKKLEEKVTREFNFMLTREYINWEESPPRRELLGTIVQGVGNYLEIMRVNRLLGPYARSEVNFTGFVDDNTPVAGRPDLVVRRDDTGYTIIDGKNGKDPANSDPDQLRWYALNMYLEHGVLANRLGFAMFRHPPGKPPKKSRGGGYDPPPASEWGGVVWVPCTQEHLRDLGVRAKRVRLAMVQGEFPATPSPAACKFCNYQTVCDAYAKSRPAPRPRKKSASSLEALVEEAGGGIVELGFRR